MERLTLTVNMIVEIPNQPFTAKVSKVLNSQDQEITNAYLDYCVKNELSLSSAEEIEKATRQFIDSNRRNSALLP